MALFHLMKPIKMQNALKMKRVVFPEYQHIYKFIIIIICLTAALKLVN